MINLSYYNQLHLLLLFFRYCKDIANLLFRELSINFQETFMLICMQKTNFINHFFLKVLYRNSKLLILCNLGMPGHTPKMIVSNFARSGTGHEVSLTVSVFTLDYFLEKPMTKIKKPYFAAIVEHFCPKLGKNKFLCNLPSWTK